MNVLVTGSEGIVGRAIVAALAEARPDARIVRASRRITSPRAIDRWIRTVDLRDLRQANDLMRGNEVDVVIHAAATPYDPSGARPFDVLAHDLQMATNVLDAAALRGVARVVLLSSAMVLDDAPSPIALAKRAAEQMVAAWSRQTGGDHTIWRLHNVVSPSEPHDRPGHVCVDLYRKIFVERATRLCLAGGGDQLRCYSWVGDVAQAIARYLTDDRASGGTFSLGSDEFRSVRQLARELVSAGRRLGILPADYDPEIAASGPPSAHDVAARIPDVSEARSRLGWAPTTSFRTCVENFVRGKRDDAR